MIGLKIINESDIQKISLNPDEREIFIRAGKKFDSLNNQEKEAIELVFKYTIESSNKPLVTFEIIQSLFDSLCIYLDNNETAVLFNLITNTRNLKAYLNQLKDEKVFTGNSFLFILQLSARYGTSLRDIIRKVQQPYDWIRIESDVLITNETIMLQSYLTRGDSQSFLFNIPFRDIATFSEHFIKRTIESCQKIDKENILEIEEKSLNRLVESVNKLKELYDETKAATLLNEEDRKEIPQSTD